MNTPLSKQDSFDQLLDTYVKELIAMSDEEALNGVDPVSMVAEGLAMLDKARDAAGGRRLEAARAKLARQKTQIMIEPGTPKIDAHEARRFLARAANDGRYTLAARDLKDMSDDEALRLYEQFKRLEGRKTPSDKE